MTGEWTTGSGGRRPDCRALGVDSGHGWPTCTCICSGSQLSVKPPVPPSTSVITATTSTILRIRMIRKRTQPLGLAQERHPDRDHAPGEMSANASGQGTGRFSTRAAQSESLMTSAICPAMSSMLYSLVLMAILPASEGL